MIDEHTELEIYTNKRSTIKSIILYIFASVLWVAISWVLISKSPVAEGRGWVTYLFIFIFGLYFIALITIATSCVADLLNHPRKLYSLSEKGYTSHRLKQSYLWQQFKPFYFSGLEKNIVTPSRKIRRGPVIERRSIKSSDFEKLLAFLKMHSPPELTKKLQ